MNLRVQGTGVDEHPSLRAIRPSTQDASAAMLLVLSEATLTEVKEEKGTWTLPFRKR